MTALDSQFGEVLVLDFEFEQRDGERPVPVCVVAHELVSGRRHRLCEELAWMRRPPYPVGDDVLVVAYYAPAELGCHLSLGWPLPVHVLDLYAEFRNLTNGLELPGGRSLLGALVYHGLDAMGAVKKERMRQLAQQGNPLTVEERKALLDYCESDVIATTKLLKAMLSNIDVPRAVLRGRYMKALAKMENVGIPIDTESLHTLRENWEVIQRCLIRKIDAEYRVYQGRMFKTERFAAYLDGRGMAWPKLESGRLALDDDTFRRMARLYPTIEPLRQLRATLGQMRLGGLAVGRDRRNRCMLSAFASKTGRNQPSNSRYIFGTPAWMRGLIKPEPGWGLAYLDWSQQEFGIAAALSGDEAMMAAYCSGDPYLAFGRQARLLPPGATKQTHEVAREQCKRCILAVQYGMSGDSLADNIGQPIWKANELLGLHRAAYRRYWEWSEEVATYAGLHLVLPTVFGWTLHVTPDTKGRTVANFPMQGNGAEMLRLASCLATENDVRVCAPVHDALLIEAPLDMLEEHVRITQEAMEEASAIVLNGFRLRSETRLILYPKRYLDKRKATDNRAKGTTMWNTVWEAVEDVNRERGLKQSGSLEPSEAITKVA
jgi:DNA polymerase-1